MAKEIFILCCICAAMLGIFVVYQSLVRYEKEISFLHTVNDIIHYFNPDFVVDNYTVNLVIDDKTLLIQIFKDKIVIYCKETAQTYIVARDKQSDVDKSLINIRDHIFLNKNDEE